MHFYAWKNGLKTGMYYLRTKAAVDAIKFTVEKAKQEEPEPSQENVAAKAAEVLQQAQARSQETTPAQQVTQPQPQVAEASKIASSQSVLFDNVSDPKKSEGEISPEELKALIQQAKDNEGDDCLMCGS